jgi:hypothetical protein
MNKNNRLSAWKYSSVTIIFPLFIDLVVCFWQVRQWVGIYGGQQEEATGTVKPLFMSPATFKHEICYVITTPF